MISSYIANDNDTIIAPATPAGGAICVIRLSGAKAIELCDKVFHGRKALKDAVAATLHYGFIKDGDEVIDDVVIGLFRSPHSYTGEDVVEISSHGSRYIVERIISLFRDMGVRMAEAGEFTRRAFLAGRMDLSQAEAVADIIAADSRASLTVAATQMRGAYSAELQELRDKLLHITSLLELELDFSEEDVEFADRTQLAELLNTLHDKVSSLARTFALGNALKHGVVVAIAGRPNVGKSTLLNIFAGEERAMVSDIAGTTRDTIESICNIDGVTYRFIDTAGMHATSDRLEKMGIERTEQALRKAHIILWVCENDVCNIISDLDGFIPNNEQKVFRIINKIDLNPNKPIELQNCPYPTLGISAKTGEGISTLIDNLSAAVDTSTAFNGDVIVSNQRHYEALHQAENSLSSAITALKNNTSADLMSEDIRQVIYHLGTITGEITSEDILKNIFSKFCIGK